MSMDVRLGCGLLVLGAALVACADEAECDSGQTLEGGQCVPAAVAGGAGSSGSGGSSGSSGAGGLAGSQAGGQGGAAGAQAGAAGADPFGGAAGGAGTNQCTGEWGTTCTDGVGHSDCGCPADYCAVQPGKTSGYCTATGCKEDPSICPSDWGCLDLAMFQPGLLSICTKP